MGWPTGYGATYGRAGRPPNERRGSAGPSVPYAVAAGSLGRMRVKASTPSNRSVRTVSRKASQLAWSFLLTIRSKGERNGKL